MPKHNINIQDGFLFQSLKEGHPMAVELVTFPAPRKDAEGNEYLAFGFRPAQGAPGAPGGPS